MAYTQIQVQLGEVQGW